ncbi:alpha/beta hydrolase [Fructilactobacillus sanfranciscensis]|uniref:Alpha/beta hydrolase n=1 Tax=Fructilactobacillus sanfranciscensis TaxID=1625 RepID=A0A5C4TJH7_FRUSA|nr:alpha/beta hydrolase [Fructilactobacillus sanfranciscensis]NDR59757.1 alpha/beta hydrolase [Fructilactobacillus sanfranciscensis]NDR69663.1 alpha/beta hydrolase [Fructilactobacillus sanfranciscensis]NDS16287.1 alpha/beta hydrolase [Fructilactobacillus sanfranciscensis]POH20727.1 cell surface protein [Fructilactobacillus sanfranciscensis]TNK90730.1 alpha/beta hydrolase [Fructilactobacillus sanfranciscensis]
MKYKKTLIFSIFILILAVGFGGWYYNAHKESSYAVKQTRTATVFIPGLGGNFITSDYMVSSWDKDGVATRALQVYVKNDGKVETTKQFAKVGKNNPVIQANFQTNNKPAQEARLMPNLMRYLHQKYGIKHVNLIGHSSGGEIIYNYLTDKDGLNKVPAKDLPQVDHFVSMANTYPLHDKNIKNLPKNLEILNFCGDIDHTGSDGLIPTQEVKPFGTLVKGHVKGYKFMVYHGDPQQAQHSMLHENPAVNKIIAQYMYN